MSPTTLAATGRKLAHRGVSSWNSFQPISPHKTLFGGIEIGRTTLQEENAGKTLDVGKPIAKILPPVVKNPLLEFVPNTAPLEIWEGTVVEVNREQSTMLAMLDSCTSNMPRHSAEFDLEWVAEQDRDLVIPGAVFYLTLFKRTRPSVENAQELRFRRRPAWSQRELDKVVSRARELRSKGRIAPFAE